jgi:Zn-dependent protease
MNLFRIYGIRLAMHVSFPLLLAWFALSGGGGWAGLCWRTGFITLLFVCVILHELGHSLTARRYGVRVSRILLTPLGGIAEFDHIPTIPREELLITLAGPGVNFVIAALLSPAFLAPLITDAPLPPHGWLSLGVHLLGANLLMGCFNLLPVFPMDGGRIFRAFLAMRRPYLEATFWAARTGQFFAVVLSLVALWLDWWLTAILFGFVFLLAGAEYRNLVRRHAEAARWAELVRRCATPLQDRELPPSA